MKKAFASIESWELLFIIRHGYIPCLILMMFGVVITAVWSDHLQKTLEPPRYNRGIYINLSGVSEKHKPWQTNGDTHGEAGSRLSENKSNGIGPENESMIEYDLFNVPPVLGVTLTEERQAYSNLMSSEMSGPLAVTNFSFQSTGVLQFGVGVALKEDDQRIAALIDRMNHVRILIVSKLEKKMLMLEKRKTLLNAAMAQLKKIDSNGNNKDIISVLQGEKVFVDFLATEIQDRLPAIRKPIKVPTLQKLLPVNTHTKSIFACISATLICSVLAGLIFGLTCLMRKQYVQDADSAAVLPP